ncbi:hypothetical protein, partial [Aquitalea pelogenes]|uniref:hypothetical protein n=1 Tax=Aquitalea pelogenes TaxID=1293573 RepID=UPI00195A521B
SGPSKTSPSALADAAARQELLYRRCALSGPAAADAVSGPSKTSPSALADAAARQELLYRRCALSGPAA